MRVFLSKLFAFCWAALACISCGGSGSYYEETNDNTASDEQYQVDKMLTEALGMPSKNIVFETTKGNYDSSLLEQKPIQKLKGTVSSVKEVNFPNINKTDVVLSLVDEDGKTIKFYDMAGWEALEGKVIEAEFQYQPYAWYLTCCRCNQDSEAQKNNDDTTETNIFELFSKIDVFKQGVFSKTYDVTLKLVQDNTGVNGAGFIEKKYMMQDLAGRKGLYHIYEIGSKKDFDIEKLKGGYQQCGVKVKYLPALTNKESLSKLLW